MPTSILQIQVDDAAFQKFTEEFAHYRQGVKDSGADWEGTARAISGSGRNLGALGRSVDGIGRGFADVANIIGGIGHGLGFAVHSMERLVKAGLAFSAAVVAGTDALARSNINARNLAASLNSTSGQTRAFGIAARASGLVSPNLPADVMRGAMNLGNLGFANLALAGTGISDQQAAQHPINATLALIQKAHDFARANRGNPLAFSPNMPEMQAFASMGLNQSTVIELGNTSEKRLQGMRAFVEHNAKALQQAKGSAGAFQLFRQRLGKAGEEVQVDLGNRIARVAPKLGTVLDDTAKRFLQLVNGVLTPKVLGGIGAGLTDLDKVLNSKTLVGGINGFATEVKSATTALGALVKLLHPLEVLEHPAKSAQHALQHTDATIGHGIRHAWHVLTGEPTQAQRLESDQATLHPSAMIGAIRTQAALHHVPFATALATGAVESDLTPDAANPRSSARGLFQQLTSMRRAFGVKDWANVAQSVRGGTTQLGDAEALARQLFPHASNAELQRAAYGIFHMGGPAFSQTINTERLFGGGQPGEWEKSWLTPSSLRSALGRFNTSRRNIHALLAADPHATAKLIREVANRSSLLTSNELADVIHPRPVSQAEAARESGVQLARDVHDVATSTRRRNNVHVTVHNATAANVNVSAATVAAGAP